MTEQIMRPTPDGISLMWEKARRDNKTLWVEAWIPDNTNAIDPRTRHMWEVIRGAFGNANGAPGYTAIKGPVIGKGSRLAVMNKRDNTLKENVHPHWVYSAEIREQGE